MLRTFQMSLVNPILFDIGVPNLVCGHFLGHGVLYIYNLAATVTLISSTSFRKMGCPLLSTDTP